MPLLHALVLGLVQGLSEFLPISSSGHLLLVPWLFGWEDFAGPGGEELEKAFDVALHVGTIAAVLAYFQRDLRRLLAAGLGALRRRSIRTQDERQAALLVLSAVPAVITGATLDALITEHLGAKPLIAAMLILFAFVLLWADRRPGRRQEGGWRRRDALLMGLAQAAALQPGVSRSGATISMGRFLGFDRDAAARLSFLMSVPITGGAVAFKMAKLFLADGGIPPGFGGAFIVGIAASAVSGFAAVAGLLRLVRRFTFTPYVAYRVVVGIGVLALAASSVR